MIKSSKLTIALVIDLLIMVIDGILKQHATDETGAETERCTTRHAQAAAAHPTGPRLLLLRRVATAVVPAGGRAAVAGTGAVTSVARAAVALRGGRRRTGAGGSHSLRRTAAGRGIRRRTAAAASCSCRTASPGGRASRRRGGRPAGAGAAGRCRSCRRRGRGWRRTTPPLRCPAAASVPARSLPPASGAPAGRPLPPAA